MFGNRSSELERRVARLERLLNEVLELVREIQSERLTGAEKRSPTKESPAGEPQPFPTPPPGRETPPSPPPEPPTPAEPPPPDVMPAGPREAVGRERPRVSKDSDPWDWQAFFAPGGPFLSRLGIALLVLSVAFFFKYSIDQGWVTPAIRLLIGLATGAALLGLGFKGAGKGEHLGTALAGGAIATFFMTGYAAHQWYALASYPVAFGFLVGASALGIGLSLWSNRQALAFVGLIGALATPFLVTSPDPRVAGLAIYLCIVVGSVSAVYLARAWRALFLTSVLGTWPLLGLATLLAGGGGMGEKTAVQAAILFSALAFWLVPLARAVLRARNPSAWPRPQGESRPPWSTHLDALSLLVPGVAILLTAGLWELGRVELGWVLFLAAFLAQGVGSVIARGKDPEDSASTQRFLSLLLSTVGVGFLLTGDVLYLAFIAEAAVLFAVGARRESRPILALGGIVELIVLATFVVRLQAGGSLLAGEIGWVLDLAAIGAAVLIGTRFREPFLRRFFFAMAYLGFMALLAVELSPVPLALYLSFVILMVASQALARERDWTFLRDLGHLPALVTLLLLSRGWERSTHLLDGELLAAADLVALAGLAYVGTLMREREVRLLYLGASYLVLLGWIARELSPLEQGQALTSLAYGVLGAVLLVVGHTTGRQLLHKTGLATLLLVVVKLLLVDLAAVEPIWRVLLFSLIGALFLVLSKVTGGREKEPGAGIEGESPGTSDQEDSDPR